MLLRTTGIMHPVINYNSSLRETINNLFGLNSKGKVNAEITEENFPIKRKGQVSAEVIMLTPETCLTTGQVFREILARNQRPARVEEMLALVLFIRIGELSASMSLAERFVFVSLGSSHPKKTSFPALYVIGERLILDLFDPSHLWTERDCFPVL